MTVSKFFYTRFVVGCLCWLIGCGASYGQNLSTDYLVQPGDTLWHILKKHHLPVSDWQAVWQANPHIKNPHRLQPGDRLRLKTDAIKLAPEVKSMPLDQRDTIAMSQLKPFLNQSQVFSLQQIEQAPAIVHAGESLQGQLGGIIHAQITAQDIVHYHIIRPQKTYHDPVDQKILGVEGRYIGSAQLQQPGKPASLRITQLQSPVQVGDKLIPKPEQTWPTQLVARTPQTHIKGQIIATIDDYKTIGPYQVVVINQGQLNGLQVGDQLQIIKPGPRIQHANGTAEPVHLAHQAIGDLMIFRVFERVAYGLVLKTSQPVEISYIVQPGTS